MKPNTKKLLKFAYFIQNKYLLKAAKNQDYVEKYRKLQDEIFDKALSYKDEEIEEQKVINLILNEMLSDDKFDKIFKTSAGSIYFLDEDKECLRLKKEDDKLTFQPITKDLFFISQDGIKVLKDIFQSLPFIEMDILSGSRQESDRPFISLEEYKIGSIPIEFNIKDICVRHSRDRLIKFKVADNKLIFYATKIKENDKPSSISDFFSDFFGGVHFGHEITEIIK